MACGPSSAAISAPPSSWRRASSWPGRPWWCRHGRSPARSRPTAEAGKAMKLARDTWLTFQYEVGQLVHSPLAIAATLLSPVTYLLLYTPFLKSVLHAPTYGDAFRT